MKFRLHLEPDRSCGCPAVDPLTQLGNLLEQVLAPDQYASNVVTRPGSNERIEFAVRLPGRGDGEPCWLPIDSKFPTEDYERLLVATEDGPVLCIGLDDSLVTQYLSPHRGIRVLAAAADLITGLSADRQRILLWRPWNPRQLAADIFVREESRHVLGTGSEPAYLEASPGLPPGEHATGLDDPTAGGT